METTISRQCCVASPWLLVILKALWHCSKIWRYRDCITSTRELSPSRFAINIHSGCKLSLQCLLSVPHKSCFSVSTAPVPAPSLLLLPPPMSLVRASPCVPIYKSFLGPLLFTCTAEHQPAQLKAQKKTGRRNKVIFFSLCPVVLATSYSHRITESQNPLGWKIP